MLMWLILNFQELTSIVGVCFCACETAVQTRDNIRSGLFGCKHEVSYLSPIYKTWFPYK